jgi:thioester reductase-like protein
MHATDSSDLTTPASLQAILTPLALLNQRIIGLLGDLHNGKGGLDQMQAEKLASLYTNILHEEVHCMS